MKKTFFIIKIKSNQITFIVTSPQHKCLGEWNSYERAPDSAEKQQTIYIWTDSAKKQQTIYIWTDSAKKTTNNLHMDSAKKQQTIYIWTDSAKKQQTIYIWTDSAKKQQQFTYGQYIFTDIVHIRDFLVRSSAWEHPPASSTNETYTACNECLVVMWRARSGWSRENVTISLQNI